LLAKHQQRRVAVIAACLSSLRLGPLRLRGPRGLNSSSRWQQRTNSSVCLRYRNGCEDDRGAMDAGESGGSAHEIRAELNIVEKTPRES